MNLSRRAAALMFGALTLAACSTAPADQEPEALPLQTLPSTTTTVLIEQDPEVELSDEDREMVNFEAAWVCELQRRTFAEPAAIEAALEEKLVDSGLTVDAYNSFRERANGDSDLRKAILFQYQETCRT